MAQRILETMPDGDAVERIMPLAARILLAGRFALPGRAQQGAIAALDDAAKGAPTRRILAAGRHGHDLCAAARGDVVLIDLEGGVLATLALVERLRGLVGDGVAFVGVLPARVDAVTRVYLSAVVDTVVEAPLRAGSLDRAVQDALASGGGAETPDTARLANPPRWH